MLNPSPQVANNGISFEVAVLANVTAASTASSLDTRCERTEMFRKTFAKEDAWLNVFRDMINLYRVFTKIDNLPQDQEGRVENVGDSEAAIEFYREICEQVKASFWSLFFPQRDIRDWEFISDEDHDLPHDFLKGLLDAERELITYAVKAHCYASDFVDDVKKHLSKHGELGGFDEYAWDPSGGTRTVRKHAQRFSEIAIDIASGFLIVSDYIDDEAAKKLPELKNKAYETGRNDGSEMMADEVGEPTSKSKPVEQIQKRRERIPLDGRTKGERDCVIRQHLVKEYEVGNKPTLKTVARTIKASIVSVRRSGEWQNREVTKTSLSLQGGPLARDAGITIEQAEAEQAKVIGKKAVESLTSNFSKETRDQLIAELEKLGINDIEVLGTQIDKVSSELRELTLAQVKENIISDPHNAALALVELSKIAN